MDNLLTRYQLSAGNLKREQKYELLCKEMDKKAASIKLAVIVAAIVFVVCFAMASLPYAISLNQEKSAANVPPETWRQAIAVMKEGSSYAWGSGPTTTNRKKLVSQIDRLVELKLPQEQKLKQLRDLVLTAPAHDGGDYYNMIVTREISDLQDEVFSDIRIEAAKHGITLRD